MQLKCFQFTFWGRPRTDPWSRIPFEDLPRTLFGEVCYSFNSRGWIDKHPLVLMRPQILRGKKPCSTRDGTQYNRRRGSNPMSCTRVFMYSWDPKSCVEKICRVQETRPTTKVGEGPVQEMRPTTKVEEGPTFYLQLPIWLNCPPWNIYCPRHTANWNSYGSLGTISCFKSYLNLPPSRPKGYFEDHKPICNKLG